jgi:hypothetical protein
MVVSPGLGTRPSRSLVLHSGNGTAARRDSLGLAVETNTYLLSGRSAAWGSVRYSASFRVGRNMRCSLWHRMRCHSLA